MAYSSVETQLIKQVDRFAKIKMNYKASVTGGTNFWTLVDAAQDETYENRIKGSDITDLDTKFNNAKFGSIASKWFSLHNSYFNTDLSLTDGLASFLSAKHWRVHQEFGELWFENAGSRLDPIYIWADETDSANVLGTLAVGGTGQSLTTLNSKFGNTRLGAKVTTQVGGGNLLFDVTVKTYISSTSTLTTTFNNITVPVGSYVDTVRMIGGQTITYINDSDSTTTLLNLQATATGFKVGGYLMIVDNSGTFTSGYGYDETFEDFFDINGTNSDNILEYVKIQAVSGTGVTVDKIRHSYNTFTQLMAYPCFTGVTALSISGTNAATSGAISIIPTDDRVIAL